LKTKIRYYRGYLDCQFSTSKPEKIGSTNNQKSFINIEPRYRFYEPVEIQESEYLTQYNEVNKFFIISRKNHDVEFYFNKNYLKSFNIIKNSKSENEYQIIDEVDTNESNSIINLADEIILILNNKSTEALTEEQYSEQYLEQYVYNLDGKNTFYSNFFTTYGKITHGKIHGKAYIKVVDLLHIEKSDIINSTNDISNNSNVFDNIENLSNNKGCFNFLSRNNSNIVGVSEANRRGCLGGINPLNSNFSGSSNLGCNRGCLPTGTNNSGCLKSLLGLILGALLTYLLMNAWLSKNTPAPKIIHDTTEVQVIKEKLDTLMILKTDTLSFVDSMSKKTYETVSLPNVQFYTNSDVLLPSSAKELQQLAEYLVKNDSLNATIFGHTDNVGESRANLQLSQRRAESVQKFLSSLGVESKRLNSKGMGDTQPKADNDKEEGRLMNRRVEVVLTNKEFSTTKRIRIPNDSNKIKQKL